MVSVSGFGPWTKQQPGLHCVSKLENRKQTLANQAAGGHAAGDTIRDDGNMQLIYIKSKKTLLKN